MKTVLVTGSNGLLGQKITENILLNKQFNLVATSKGSNRYPVKEGYTYADMDILDAGQVRNVVAQYKPDAIIHTAAMTNVDTCQVEKELARALNVDALKTLVAVCETMNIQLVHLSTDFVFDGEEGPYDESARPNPLSYYGQTKVEAEVLIQNSHCRWSIIRTILVYGIVKDMSRSNIVLWAKNALEKATPLNVVNDQWRMPTLAEDLAWACLKAVEKEVTGIYHISGKDMMSVSELVSRVADYFGLDKSLMTEVSSATLNQSAARPKRTGFILDKAMRDLDYTPHSFKEGIAILEQQMSDNS
jgi:dTDP-4-dehydrorhamnose reductase